MTCVFVPLQIDAFQHMQHFVQGMQQQAQHAIAAEDQQHKQELHKLMARFVVRPFSISSPSTPLFFLRKRIFAHLRWKNTGVNYKKKQKRKSEGTAAFLLVSKVSGFWYSTRCLAVAHLPVTLDETGR